MKTATKIAMSIVVCIMALSLSAFTTARKFASATFYQTSTDNYVRIDNAGGICSGDKTHACSIFYATAPSVTSFTYSTRPSGGTDSSDKKLWVPN